MTKDIYEPLEEYVNVFRDRFRSVAETTFSSLAAEAQIDVESNRTTCRQLYSAQQQLSSIKTRITTYTVVCVLFWLIAISGIALPFFIPTLQKSEILVPILIIALLILIVLFVKIHPRIKQLKEERHDLDSTVNSLSNEAWEQMKPLNRLYDWDVLTRMMSQTVPRLEFDPYFTVQRLADLKATYGWDESFNSERSVICSHSGLINGNPFVICRTKKMEMGSKTYYGSKTIYWTTQERGSDGKYHTVHHSQTLTASVVAPFPKYIEKTRLIYGNTAAPDLTFYRQQSGLAGRENSISYKWKKRMLRKKARNLEDHDFAMMTNEDFEVAFNTSNRNDNQQFALLFTPLAQESILRLLRDEEVGYGDDFDFYKQKMINTIVANHMQHLPIDMNPQLYHHFDYDKAQADFYAINAEHFRAIYFCLAPLLCVPMYQQIRPHHEIYGNDMHKHSAYWEHEAIANFWGKEHFQHPDCATDCILKTKQILGENEQSRITVHAYGYRIERRLTYISKWGGDGRLHDVPVYWDEYLPVVGTGSFEMQEDNTPHHPDSTHRDRLTHIHKVLSDTGLNVYRRHIASGIR